MKKVLLFILTAVALAFSGCEKENGENEGKIICGEYTKINNMVQCIGCASEDEEAIYFSVLDGDYLTLVRQDKQSGTRLILDSIEKPESNIDYCFQFIQAKGDYVYYMPFDVSDYDNRTYKIWRVKKDGSEKSVLFAQDDDEIYEFYILNNRIYYRYFLVSQGVYSCALDGSDRIHVLDKDMSYPILYKDRFYYIYYTDFPTIRLASCKKDGTDLQTILPEFPTISYMNFLKDQLFFTVYSGNATYGPGLYKYDKGQLSQLIKGTVLNFAMLDGGKIIYMNVDDTSCGRLGASYETDINGSYNNKL